MKLPKLSIKRIIFIIIKLANIQKMLCVNMQLTYHLIVLICTHCQQAYRNNSTVDKARFIWLTYTSKDCLFLSHRGKLGFLILSLHKSKNIVNSFVECHVCRNKCSINQAMNDMRTNPSVEMCPVSVLYLFALSLSCLCNNCTVYNTQNS